MTLRRGAPLVPAVWALAAWAASAVAAHEPPQAAGASQTERGARMAEAALAQGDAALAGERFEQAANLQHTLDIELGIVRSHMQAGDYRRALAFAAHGAGVHGDEPEGAAAYAWLLQLGAQQVFARRVLGQALQRLPGEPLLSAMERALEAPAPVDDARWKEPPLRLAPYATGDRPPSGARLVSAGLLVDAGRHALVPAEALGSRPDAWLRDGLGRTVHAVLARRVDAIGVAVLRLERPLDADAAGLPVAVERDAFPGSPAYVMDHLVAQDAKPAWPRLRPGFLGPVDPAHGGRSVGIDRAGGADGAPVLDRDGRLVGLALAREGAPDRLIPASALRRELDGLLAPPAVPRAVRMPVDELYERGLRWTLQVITAAP